ncbi:E3 ubiquitin-protein ligase TRAIP-like isoform X2 [Planococcus citri]
MQIVCSICRDAFTGADNETIYTTSCGHVFHHRCLVQWMQRSKTCPHCRMNLTNKNMFKLNLYFEGTAGPRNGLENAQQQTQQFEQAMKNIDMRQLRESARIATEQSKGLRLQVRKLEDELKAVKSRECDLLGKIRNLEQEVRSERQKNLHFGGSNQGADDDVIHLLDDSDPELLLDIDANLQQMRRNREQEPEVIDLDDTEM